MSSTKLASVLYFHHKLTTNDDNGSDYSLSDIEDGLKKPHHKVVHLSKTPAKMKHSSRKWDKADILCGMVSGTTSYSSEGRRTKRRDRSVSISSSSDVHPCNKFKCTEVVPLRRNTAASAKDSRHYQLAMQAYREAEDKLKSTSTSSTFERDSIFEMMKATTTSSYVAGTASNNSSTAEPYHRPTLAKSTSSASIKRGILASEDDCNHDNGLSFDYRSLLRRHNNSRKSRVPSITDIDSILVDGEPDDKISDFSDFSFPDAKPRGKLSSSSYICEDKIVWPKYEKYLETRHDLKKRSQQQLVLKKEEPVYVNLRDRAKIQQRNNSLPNVLIKDVFEMSGKCNTISTVQSSKKAIHSSKTITEESCYVNNTSNTDAVISSVCNGRTKQDDEMLISSQKSALSCRRSRQIRFEHIRNGVRCPDNGLRLPPPPPAPTQQTAIDEEFTFPPPPPHLMLKSQVSRFESQQLHVSTRSTSPFFNCTPDTVVRKCLQTNNNHSNKCAMDDDDTDYVTFDSVYPCGDSMIRQHSNSISNLTEGGSYHMKAIRSKSFSSRLNRCVAANIAPLCSKPKVSLHLSTKYSSKEKSITAMSDFIKTEIITQQQDHNEETSTRNLLEKLNLLTWSKIRIAKTGNTLSN